MEAVAGGGLKLPMVIFLNYRREDSSAITRLIDDRLRVEFGGDSVYRDIDSIPLGVDFAEHIGEAVRKCDLLLAVVGDRWATRRLFDEKDFVRKEIEVALERGIPVIPVLVDGAGLPSRTDLPESLHPMLGRQGIAVHSGASFTDDAERLVTRLRRALRPTEKPRDFHDIFDIQEEIEPLVVACPQAPGGSNLRRRAQLLAGLWGFAAIGFVAGVIIVASSSMTSLTKGKVGLVGAAVGALVFLGIWFRRGSPVKRTARRG